MLLLKTVSGKPLGHRADAVFLGGDERLNLLLGEVQTVVLVVRVADIVKQLLQDIKVRLRKRDAKLDDMVRVRRRVLYPDWRGLHSFLDREVPVQDCRRGLCRDSDGRRDEDEGEGAHDGRREGGSEVRP